MRVHYRLTMRNNDRRAVRIYYLAASSRSREMWGTLSRQSELHTSRLKIQGFKAWVGEANTSKGVMMCYFYFPEFRLEWCWMFAGRSAKESEKSSVTLLSFT